MVSVEDVREALKKVYDPELRKDIVSAEMVKDISVDSGKVKVVVELTTPACPLKDDFLNDVKKVVGELDGVESVDVEFTSRVLPVRRGRKLSGFIDVDKLDRIKNIIAVGSAKGGVGKTTVAVNIAVALAQMGAKTGLLDADFHGPNVPNMLNLEVGSLKADWNNKIIPSERYGLKVVSLGQMVEPGKAVAWRGPITNSAIKQLLEDVAWDELDYLIIDLPPGTGDVHLTLAQGVPIVGTVMVTTPQEVAVVDTIRGIELYESLQIPTLGIVENMAYFVCPHCGQKTEIFKGRKLHDFASNKGIPIIASLPLTPEVADSGEEGKPIVVLSPDSIPAQELRNAASQVAALISIMSH